MQEVGPSRLRGRGQGRVARGQGRAKASATVDNTQFQNRKCGSNLPSCSHLGNSSLFVTYEWAH